MMTIDMLIQKIRDVLHSSPIAELWESELEQLINDQGYTITMKEHWYHDLIYYRAIKYSHDGSETKRFVYRASLEFDPKIIPYLELWKLIKQEEKVDEILFGR